MRPHRETTTAPAGNTLVAHPPNCGSGTWRAIYIEHLESGQARAYADSRWTYRVTIEGGTRSTRPGFDLPFGVKPTDAYIEALARFIHGWKETRDTRKRGGMDVHFATYLDRLEVTEQDDLHTEFIFTVVSAYTG